MDRRYRVTSLECLLQLTHWNTYMAPTHILHSTITDSACANMSCYQRAASSSENMYRCVYRHNMALYSILSDVFISTLSLIVSGDFF